MIETFETRLRARASAGRAGSLLVALGFVAAAAVIRLSMQPVFGGDHAFIAFYPAVILATYLAGRRAGLIATVASAILAYWLFEAPALTLKVRTEAWAAPVFFAVNAAVAVYVIARLNENLVRTAREQGRAEAAARQNADIFRELNDRVAHHLQLVSGVLALRARDDPTGEAADALAKASQASLMLARAHRDCAGRTEGLVDVLPLATRLIEVKLADRGLPPGAISVSGDAVQLSVDQATSLGAALLECLGALLERRQPGRLGFEFRRHGDGVMLRVSELDEGALASLSDAFLLRASLQQLGARVALAPESDGDALEILFRPDGPSDGDAAGVTIH